VTALDTINRLDDGLPVSPADLALLEIAEQDASDRWYRIDRQVESWQADICYCGQPAEGGECVSCHNDVETELSHLTDI
jgi:hypothetical protein